jgi:hypothetical protein
MATEIKLRRGTTAQHTTFTGAEGEVTVDTTKDTLVVHDGSTAGGHPVAKENNPKLTGNVEVNYQNSTDTNYYGLNVWGRDYPTVSINATGAYDYGGSFQLEKSRGSHSSPTVVLAEDEVGVISFRGYSGTDMFHAGRIAVKVDGTPGSSSMPGRLELRTTPTGATEPVTRVSIRQTGTTEVYGNLELSKAIKENVFTITDGASVDLNPANGTIQLWTLGASRSPTATNFAAGQSMTLMVLDGSAFTITWPSVAWVGGTPPTLDTTKYTVIELWAVGTTLYGALVGVV